MIFEGAIFVSVEEAYYLLAAEVGRTGKNNFFVLCKIISNSCCSVNKMHLDPEGVMVLIIPEYMYESWNEISFSNNFPLRNSEPLVEMSFAYIAKIYSKVSLKGEVNAIPTLVC